MVTAKQITQAILSSAISEVYDLSNLTSKEDYTPEQLETATYILINSDDQTWQPGYETKLPAETVNYYAGSIYLS